MFINSFRNLTEIFLHSTSVEGMDSASLSNKLWDEASRGRERETQREGGRVHCGEKLKVSEKKDILSSVHLLG